MAAVPNQIVRTKDIIRRKHPQERFSFPRCSHPWAQSGRLGPLVPRVGMQGSRAGIGVRDNRQPRRKVNQIDHPKHLMCVRILINSRNSIQTERLSSGAEALTRCGHAPSQW
jgi:hypothetical protein